MSIEFDPLKQAMTLRERGLDFSRAADLFDGEHITIEDDREDDGEARFITVGRLDGRMVVIVWTWRGDAQRTISMRKANDREQETFGKRLDRS
ncbi:BrnT family toxin [Rhizobium sp. TRM95111]|uniref:BrnT family toxin n=1 Tax=Rhizobium alarense TaxID=2846851 RepID=UPI001F2E8FD7|nr:BrnT family toxin [Rhizobium alarense]MCF3638557.1 BrnT family toxin [Rhizobium alarense]